MKPTTGVLWDYLMPVTEENKVYNCIKEKKEFNSVRQHPNEVHEFMKNVLYVVEYEKYQIMNAQEERFSENTFVFVNEKDDPDFRPEDCNLSAIIVMNKSYKDVFTEVSDILVDFNEWTDEINDALISNVSLNELVGIGQKYIINPFIILDEALDVIAFTNNIREDDVSFQETIKKGYTPPALIAAIMEKRGAGKKRFDEDSVYTDGALMPYAEVNMPVLVDGKIVAVIYMHCTRVEPSEGAVDVLRFFADKLGYYFRRNAVEPVQHNVNNERIGNFLGYVLSHELSQQEIMMMAESALFPYNARFNLYLIEPRSEISVKYILNRMREYLPIEKCFCYENRIILLSAFIWKNNSSEEHLVSLNKRLCQMMEELEFYCGVSRGFDNLSQLKDAYTQACAALDIGKQITDNKNGINNFEWKEQEKSIIFNYDNLSLHHVLKTCSKELPYKSMCAPQILTMLRHDKEKGTDNYKVLYTYLENDRVTSEAAQLLHMHRNNVNYRIKRIEELFGLNLSDSEERLRIQMSFRILDLMDADDI